VHALHAAIARRTCVFVGQSGVGKSSLLNQLDPDSARRTGAEREKDGKGRHTTTGSRLVTLADGTRLVDTPGVRAFGLWADDRADLVAAFPDVDALADGCRFADCRHVSEPDCAVQAALSDGRLDSSRLEAWTRLIASLE
jgi:ribosome biogenesis GTPase